MQRLDLLQQDGLVQVLSSNPLLSSFKSGWNGISLAYCHQPAGEVCEHTATQHLLAITDQNSHAAFENRIEGELITGIFGHGEIGFCPANVRRWAAWDKAINLTLIALDLKILDQASAEFADFSQTEFIPQFHLVDPVIQHIALALKRDLEAGCPAGTLYGDSFGVALATHLWTICSTSKLTLSKKIGGLSNDTQHQIVDYIQSHLDQDIRLADLAQLVNMSHYYFCRQFKYSFGITLHQYLVRQRVERAKQLLRQRHLSVLEVALHCGFAHQSHLSRHFKRLVGISPGTFRNQN